MKLNTDKVARRGTAPLASLVASLAVLLMGPDPECRLGWDGVTNVVYRVEMSRFGELDQWTPIYQGVEVNSNFFVTVPLFTQALYRVWGGQR